jgi:hypothetical protein
MLQKTWTWRCLYCNLTYIPSGIALRVELLDHMAILLLIFWGASILFFIVVLLTYIPTSSVWGFLFPLHPHQHFLLFVFLILAILTVVRWNLSVVLSCMSFMASDAEHFFMCILAIWTSSFEKALFRSFAHFFIGSLLFWEFSFFRSLYVLVINLW